MRTVLVSLLVLAATAVAALDAIDLQKAVSQGRPGQVIDLVPGDYIGPLVVDRAVVLRARAGARLVHPGLTAGPTLTVSAAGARVEGLEVVGTGRGTRRDLTAVVVSGDDVVLRDLVVRDAYAGLWIDADRVTVDGMEYRGLADFPFWERGEAIRVIDARGTRLSRLNLSYSADALLLSNAVDTRVEAAVVIEARYGVHVMFGADGVLERIQTRRTVAGLMVMETSGWAVRNSSFTEGFRLGSAGIRLIRSKNLSLVGNRVARQASGMELLDLRSSRIEGNRVEENATAWTWGGDNSGTLITANRHRGNLIDLSGTEATGEDWDETSAHDHGSAVAPVAPPPSSPRRPLFDGNFWDAWKGLDLDGDGVGDTAYRFDRAAALRAAARPWSGLFLGSPWSLLSQSLPGGELLDARPLVHYY